MAPGYLTRTAPAWLVAQARARGGSWGPLAQAWHLRADTVERRAAPRWTTATLTLLLEEGRHHLEAEQFVGVDDWIRIYRYVPGGQAVEADHLFDGLVTSVRTQADAHGAATVIRCHSLAWRLWRDRLVFGQYRRSALQAATHPAGAEGVSFYAGLPCEFNPGGRPNMDPVDFTTADGEAPEFRAPLFCEPGAAGARWWTWRDALQYLQWFYNGDQGFIANRDFTPAERLAGGWPLAIERDLTGLRLWEALALVARAGGADLFETIAPTAEDETALAAAAAAAGESPAPAGPGVVAGISHAIAVVPWGTGSAVSIRLQAAADAPVLDLEQTNLFGHTLDVDAAAAVTCPCVAGGRPLYELAVPLTAAWTAADLDTTLTLPSACPPAAGEMGLDYAKRYVTSGAEHAQYRDAGRYWRAITDAASTADDFCDLAALVGEAAGSWPPMRHRPLALLAATATAGGEPAFAEISWDAGDTWVRLAQAAIADDELAIRITAADLRAVANPADDEQTLWGDLAGAAADPPTADVPLVRLVCCVAGPSRPLAWPARRPGGGTSFAASHWFDRGAAFQRRTRTAGSPLAADDAAPAGASDGTHQGLSLDAYATRLQDLLESRLIHASLPLEIPLDDVELGDTVERIEGVELDLAANSGPARRAPRIVAIRHDLQRDGMVLMLDTDREGMLA
ncbi:MAG: hypothetical protein GX591_20540 [Planctomycetes bacterium]|nr:hypothetical protein [Planctomycetota bacterium]